MNWLTFFREQQDVKAFQERFMVPMARVPSMLTDDLFDFRYRFLQEEITEWSKAQMNGDLPEAADALVDLAYVLHGTALMMGLPWSHLWRTVHEKNMQKVRVARADDSKRGSIYDVVKPAGWTPPDHRIVLGHGPWPVFKP